MRRVLVVTPRFPPVNAPDHHRVRTSLPYFSRYGWNPTVLAVAPDADDKVIDPLLAESIPPEIAVHRVQAWQEKQTRRFGFGHLDNRCVAPLFRVGSKLLSALHYDVIYFSTTVFATFVLARLWKRRFRCKIVFDFQDPWYQAGNHGYDSTNAPGGWIKYQLSQALSRFEEAFALKAADHVISTSEAYARDLSNRYPWLTKDKFSVIPFGASAQDYETAMCHKVRHDIFQPGDGFMHWTYVGRGGPDMIPVLTALFESLARLKKASPEVAGLLRLHFVGTNYAPPERTYKVIEPIAARCGVSDLVSEHSPRIPYFQALALMAQSDAVLLIGSSGADYTASKLFNCVLSRKPVLALLHAESLVSQMITNFPNTKLVPFHKNPAEPGFDCAVDNGIQWLMRARPDSQDIDANIEPYSAEQLTKAQCAIFDRLVAA
jgi:hypothetical protein